MCILEEKIAPCVEMFESSCGVIHNSGDDFKVFLEAQEQVIGDLMKKLGFL